MPISLSEAAAKEVKRIIDEQKLPAEQTRLRVGVRGGGGSGVSYLVDLTEDAPSEQDEAMDSHGVPILVDMKSLLYLDGTEIDFRDGGMGRGFVFKNPTAPTA